MSPVGFTTNLITSIGYGLWHVTVMPSCDAEIRTSWTNLLVWYVLFHLNVVGLNPAEIKDISLPRVVPYITF